MCLCPQRVWNQRKKVTQPQVQNQTMSGIFRPGLLQIRWQVPIHPQDFGLRHCQSQNKKQQRINVKLKKLRSTAINQVIFPHWRIPIATLEQIRTAHKVSFWPVRNVSFQLKDRMMGGQSKMSQWTNAGTICNSSESDECSRSNWPEKYSGLGAC